MKEYQISLGNFKNPKEDIHLRELLIYANSNEEALSKIPKELMIDDEGVEYFIVGTFSCETSVVDVKVIDPLRLLPIYTICKFIPDPTVSEDDLADMLTPPMIETHIKFQVETPSQVTDMIALLPDHTSLWVDSTTTYLIN